MISNMFDGVVESLVMVLILIAICGFFIGRCSSPDLNAAKFCEPLEVERFELTEDSMTLECGSEDE